MRRFGLYADVHANVLALEAVIADMSAEGVSERYCLGDLVGYGPWPGEAVELVRSLGDPVVQGNYDRALGGRLREPGTHFGSPQETLDGAESYAYTIAHTDRLHRRYLSRLPREITITERGTHVYLCHGSPRRLTEVVQPDAPPGLLVSLVRQTGADVVCSGHSHIPFHRSIPTERGIIHWVNAGSVGRPRDGDPRACWVEIIIGPHDDVVLLTPGDLSTRRIGESDLWLGVRIHRVTYDVDAVVHVMVERGLPATLASALRTGSEECRVLAPTSSTESVEPDEWLEDEHGAHPPEAFCGAAPCTSDDRRCSCVLPDRIAAYQAFADAFSVDGSAIGDVIERLAASMNSCRDNPHIDEAAIVAARTDALVAAHTERGATAFEAERERLYGDSGAFDPFSHALSASELTYLSGDSEENAAAITAIYETHSFDPGPCERDCLGHISVECRYMVHCLTRVHAGDIGGSHAAREFFVGHLADWAVLFAVVTAQQAREPIMRYIGLALDKYLICEAATFRHSVPEYCGLRESEPTSVLSSADADPGE